MNKAKRNFNKYAGIHLLIEFWQAKKIENPEKLEKILIKAAEEAKNHVLKTSIHKFYPQGITGIVLLAESHIAIHAWPEFDYVAVDIFTCGQNAKPYQALNYLKKIYKPKRVEIKEIKRGKR